MSSLNYLIGRGELLADAVPAPPMKPEKAEPYTAAEASAFLAPQLASTVQAFVNDDSFAPDDVQVARFTLHPSYVAKSYYPSRLLQYAGLEAVGSRDRVVMPHHHVVKDWEEKRFGTSELFVAGTAAAFARLADAISSAGPIGEGYDEIRKIEEIRPFNADDKVRRPAAPVEAAGGFELVVHLPSERLAPSNRSQFLSTAKALGVEVRSDLGFEVRGLWFLPAFSDTAAINALAEFTTLRVARRMPELSVSPVTRSLISAGSTASLPPAGLVLDPQARIAILDGGLPADHPLEPWVESYREMDPGAANSPGYEQHGLAVASAFLFGPLRAGATAPVPPAKISVFRVLDSSTASEDPFELYKTLGHVEEVLLSRSFDFVNLSLGPLLPVDDDEVHAWTSLIDDLLSDGATLLTVAAGNNGDADWDSGNARVQVPGDAVNVLTVGAFHRDGDDTERAPYSAVGPGRSPGRIKPDLLAFGGSTEGYFHFVSSDETPELVPGNGTSLAAPLSLRHGVAIRARLGDELSPLTIRTLMLHAADPRGHAAREVGWGFLPLDADSMVTSGEGVARVVYQGEIRPGKYLRAKLPVPAGGYVGRVKVSATFCFASAIDSQSPDAYTRAGLDVTFRPNLKKFKVGAKTPTSRSFFSAQPYADENARRSEQGKWETVLRAADRMEASTLTDPAFDIHYVARDSGSQSRETAPMSYSLIITVEAPKMADLHNRILATYPGLLVPIEPRIEIDLQT